MVTLSARLRSRRLKDERAKRERIERAKCVKALPSPLYSRALFDPFPPPSTACHAGQLTAGIFLLHSLFCEKITANRTYQLELVKKKSRSYYYTSSRQTNLKPKIYVDSNTIRKLEC